MNKFFRLSIILAALGFLVASIALVYGFSITGKVVEISPTGMVITDSAGGTVACTADAKLCPDGSYVGRVPPSCNFETCPGCELLWWFDNEHRECSQKDFCGLYMYQGLQTFETKESCLAALGSSECYASGTSCCRGDVCAQSAIAICSSGVAPKFYGCNDDCTPIWKCPEPDVSRCYDSDNGKNYYVKGTIELGQARKTDSCTYCTGACPVPTAGDVVPCEVTCGAVVEYSCGSDGAIAEETYVCPEGCSEGACIKEEPACGNNICEPGEADECPACYYSDPPCLAPCTVGTCPEDCEKQECIAEGQSLGAVVPGNQNVCCAGLSEISAMSSVGGRCEPMLGNRGYCTDCGDGVCKSPENACNCPVDCGVTAECADSDGGRNYYVKGIVKTDNARATDSCTYCTGACPVPTTGDVVPCEVTCGAVVEYSCGSDGAIDDETFSCPDGCSDGACIGTKQVCTSNRDCGEGMFCEFRLGGCEGGEGNCVNKPDVCIDLYSPVCGCDGKTYSNDCVRQAAGVSKKSEGQCGEVPVKQCDIVCKEAGYEYGLCRPGALPDTEADRSLWCHATEVDVGTYGCPSLGQRETPTTATVNAPQPTITEQTQASGASGGASPVSTVTGSVIESTTAGGQAYPGTCFDNVRESDETGVDCGGSCKPCGTGTSGSVGGSDGTVSPPSTGTLLNYHCCCGNKIPEVCTPVCKAIGSRSEGWYDSCTGALISYDKCTCLAICRGIGSEREGYYSSCTGDLIVSAKCSISESVEVTIKDRRVEISQDVTEGVVRITSQDSATTQESLRIAEGSLGMVTSEGVKDVNYLPEEAKDKATRYGGLIKVTGIELVDDNGQPVYEVEGKTRGYFLWVIPISKDGTVMVDAETNQIIE